MTVVEYAIATGLNVTPDEAADGLFPGCRTVYLGCETFGMTRTHYFLVEQGDGSPDLP